MEWFTLKGEDDDQDEKDVKREMREYFIIIILTCKRVKTEKYSSNDLLSWH